MTELGFQTIVISDHIAAALSSQERARVAHASALLPFHHPKIKTHRLKRVPLEGSWQRRKLDAAADGVDAFGADADAVAEFPDVAGVRASPA
jgi:hypothetical protein